MNKLLLKIFTPESKTREIIIKSPSLFLYTETGLYGNDDMKSDINELMFNL